MYRYFFNSLCDLNAELIKLYTNNSFSKEDLASVFILSISSLISLFAFDNAINALGSLINSAGIPHTFAMNSGVTVFVISSISLNLFQLLILSLLRIFFLILLFIIFSFRLYRTFYVSSKDVGILCRIILLNCYILDEFIKMLHH